MHAIKIQFQWELHTTLSFLFKFHVLCQIWEREKQINKMCVTSAIHKSNVIQRLNPKLHRNTKNKTGGHINKTGLHANVSSWAACVILTWPLAVCDQLHCRLYCTSAPLTASLQKTAAERQ